MKQLVVLLVLMLCSCSSDKEWKMVWNDEFNYSGLPDSTKWNFDTVGNSIGWGNNEQQFYTDSNTKNVMVNNGTLIITAHKELLGDKNYTSARLTTKGKGDWLYGKIEVRIKVSPGNGLWPAVWMLPTENSYGKWPNSGEIDIMEYVGYDRGVVHSTAHTKKHNHILGTQMGNSLNIPDLESDFHVYSIEWDENCWKSFVDGKHYYTYTNDGTGYESWPFDQKFHLIINLAVGGNWGGIKGIDDTIFPSSIEVDYVRVYKKI